MQHRLFLCAMAGLVSWGCAGTIDHDLAIEDVGPEPVSLLETDGGTPVRQPQLAPPLLVSEEGEKHDWVLSGGFAPLSMSGELDYLLVGPLSPNIAIVLRNSVTGAQIVANKHFSSDLTSLRVHAQKLSGEEHHPLTAYLYTYLFNKPLYDIKHKSFHELRSQTDELRRTKDVIESFGIPRASIKAVQIGFDSTVPVDPNEVSHSYLVVMKDGTIGRADVVRNNSVNPVKQPVRLTNVLEEMQRTYPFFKFHALLSQGVQDPRMGVLQPAAFQSVIGEFFTETAYADLPSPAAKVGAILRTLRMDSDARFDRHVAAEHKRHRACYGKVPFYTHLPTL